MTENQLNSIIGKSLDWRHKIGDAGVFQKPFDGIGIYNGQSVYWEAKNLKKAEAFNFNRLENHQINNLLTVQKLNPSSLTLLLIAVDFGRADKRVFVFKDMDYINKRKENKESIKKKEFENRKNYVVIKKGLIDMGEIVSMDKDLEYDF